MKTKKTFALVSAEHQKTIERVFCWRKLALFLLSATIISACSAKDKVPSDGLFAKIETDKGVILAQLEFEKTPLTVMSFVGLAEGRFDAPNAPKGKHYFDGLSFHRVEPGFVIQGGDPKGNGTGGPGYEFSNEIDPTLNHDQEGILSMANAGPDTNGSQFFITLGPASFLNGSYSVFGHVVEGMEVVKRIEKDDKIQKVSIIRQGTAAEAFQPNWEQFQQLSQKVSEEHAGKTAKLTLQGKQGLEAFAKERWPEISFKQTDANLDGLLSYIQTPGRGKTGSELGDVKQYQVHYSLWAPSASGSIEKIDSSLDRGQPIQIAPDQVIPAWGSTMPLMQIGEKRVILVPSELGYGKSGSPPSIQPDSYLLFEMEMLDFIR